MNLTNIVDVVIVLFIGLWGVLGLKRGVIKQSVMTLGTLLIFIIAFYLKNPIAEFLSVNLPFFDFFGAFKGIVAINIIFYQLLSFILVVCLLQAVLNLLIKISSIIETLLKLTVILAIPSKILGFILGLLEGFVIAYIALFFINQPLFNFSAVNESELTTKILGNTPILSNVAGGVVNTFNDLYGLGEKYKNTTSDSVEFNLEAIDVMLKNKVVTPKYIDALKDKGKVNITGIDNVVNKYR